MFDSNRIRTSPNAKAAIPLTATVMPAHVYPNMKTATANYAEASARMKAANTAANTAAKKSAAALKDFLEIESSTKPLRLSMLSTHKFKAAITMTTKNASQRRNILANAHAKYFSSRRTGDDSLAVSHALTRANVISSTDRIVNIGFQETTLVVSIDPDLDVLEIDAYGNVLRGAV